MNYLAQILIENILVFAYCEESEVDPDFAISQLERIAHQLRESSAATIAEIKKAISGLARNAEKSGDLERAERLRLMPGHLGLQAES